MKLFKNYAVKSGNVHMVP